MAHPGLTVDSVGTWYDKRALESEGTAKAYRSNLTTYWINGLQSQRFSTVDDWVAQVREQQRSDDIETRRRWALDLEAFINGYVSRHTGRPFVKGAKNTFIASIQSYLKHCLGDRLESYSFTLGTKAERLAELRQKDDVAPVTIDEIKKVYTEAKNRRDRAIISTLVSGGCGVAEWLQFANEWHRYANDIRESKVPIRVSVTRPKTLQTYVHFLWDDATEDVRGLLEERERELGRQLNPGEPLFANQYGQPIEAYDVQKTIRRLADRSGVEARTPGKVSYRIRPHELGKDFFRTQLAIARVDRDVAEYLTGHVVDSNSYNKFHKTPEGKAIIEKEASKLRPLLNIRTAKGRAETDKDTRLIAAEELLKSLLPDVWEKYQLAARTLTTDAALDWIRSEFKTLGRMTTSEQAKEAVQEYLRIDESEADNHLNHGYELVTVLPSGKLLVRRKKAQP